MKQRVQHSHAEIEQTLEEVCDQMEELGLLTRGVSRTRVVTVWTDAHIWWELGLYVLDDGCVLPFEQSPEPNEHNADVPLLDEASCDVSVEGYRGPVNIGGVMSFGRDQPTIEIHVTGNVPPAADPNAPGAASGSWNYTFLGQRPQ